MEFEDLNDEQQENVILLEIEDDVKDIQNILYKNNNTLTLENIIDLKLIISGIYVQLQDIKKLRNLDFELFDDNEELN